MSWVCAQLSWLSYPAMLSAVGAFLEPTSLAKVSLQPRHVLEQREGDQH